MTAERLAPEALTVHWLDLDAPDATLEPDPALVHAHLRQLRRGDG